MKYIINAIIQGCKNGVVYKKMYTCGNRFGVGLMWMWSIGGSLKIYDNHFALTRNQSCNKF